MTFQRLEQMVHGSNIIAIVCTHNFTKINKWYHRILRLEKEKMLAPCEKKNNPQMLHKQFVLVVYSYLRSLQQASICADKRPVAVKTV